MNDNFENDLMEEEKFYVQRPVPEGVEVDQFNMPVIRAVHESDTDFETIIPINFQSLNKHKDNSHMLALLFRKDKCLNALWEKSLKYIPLITSVGAIVTPDFSVDAAMNSHWMNQYVFRNRYLGCLWQSYGVMVIPSIGWGDSTTYDICFSGVEPGGVVCISTLGANKNMDMFQKGFEEMKKRLRPTLIIVYGDIIPAMHGQFLNYKYTEAFSRKLYYEQLTLFQLPRIFTREVG